MPVIRPFKALRYNTEVAGDIETLVAPPYDIIFDEWRERLYARNAHNIIRLIKSKDEPGDTDAANRYTRAAGDIRDWMASGVLALDTEPAVYVRSDTYEVAGEHKTRIGFVALLKLEDFGTHVFPHEKTLSSPKVDRLNLVKATGTNLSQVFATFQDPGGEVQSILTAVVVSTPDISFTDEQGIVRSLWRLTDPAVSARMVDLMAVRDVVIADGHHRYETALNYRALREPDRKGGDEPFDYISMYFSNADAEGMTILPTHRKIGGVADLDIEAFFTALAREYTIETIGPAHLDDIIRRIAEGSETTNIFGIYTRDGYRIARHKNPAAPKRLDVAVLHGDIIEGLFGITPEDVAAGRFVHFSKSAEHAIEDVAAGKDQVCFLLNAVRTDELFRCVRQDGARMPQKSTYFYPKTLSGLVMYLIDPRSLG